MLYKVIKYDSLFSSNIFIILFFYIFPFILDKDMIKPGYIFTASNRICMVHVSFAQSKPETDHELNAPKVKCSIPMFYGVEAMTVDTLSDTIYFSRRFAFSIITFHFSSFADFFEGSMKSEVLVEHAGHVTGKNHQLLQLNLDLITWPFESTQCIYIIREMHCLKYDCYEKIGAQAVALCQISQSNRNLTALYMYINQLTSSCQYLLTL